MMTSDLTSGTQASALHSRSILFTNVNGTGDDVMVFTRLGPETLRPAFNKQGIVFDDAYEVPEKDVGTYVYEPCWLSAAEEARALDIHAKLVGSA